MKIGFGRQRKLVSISIFLLAILFYIFFDACKHIPSLAEVNPFAVDPYDAVGSFGIQLALFAALLSLIRMFRPYTGDEIIAYQKELIRRGEMITILSIAVTLGADIVSLLRTFPAWLPSPAGRTLALMVGGMAVVTALAAWAIAHYSESQLTRGSWRPGAIICPAGILILAVYPSFWDESIIGGISTALLGMLLFFTLVWALSIGISTEIYQGEMDFFDDLGAVFIWIKAHYAFAGRFFQMVEKFMDHSWIRSVFGWLDLRKHPWNLVGIVAIIMGSALAAAEAIGEGISPIPGRFVIVMIVFIGIEIAGVLFGYTLLARFLGIYHRIKSV